MKKRIQNNILFQNTLREICLSSRILESEQYIQHGNISLLVHSIAVAYFSYSLALLLKIPVDERKLIRGALLHDYFLYDWHEKNAKHKWHGFRHPFVALENANQDLELSNTEKDIIVKHMFPLTPIPPKYTESLLVCIVDKVCSIYETFYFDSFLKIYENNMLNLAVHEEFPTSVAIRPGTIVEK